MKNKFLYITLLIFVSCLLLSCGAKSSSAAGNNGSVSQKSNKKGVDIFGTTYELEDSWRLNHESNSKNVYTIDFEYPHPDNKYDVISVVNMPDALSGGTSWDLANQYIDLMEKEVVPNFFDGQIETEEYNKDKTPGRRITGRSRLIGFDGTCYIFMNNFNDAVLIMYYHTNEDIDHSTDVQEMVDSMEFSFDGFKNEVEPQKSLGFTNKYGTPTTKCAHRGCSNYIAPSGDTNCCEEHSNKCLNCGIYIDGDATYCMDCLSDAAENK